MIESNATPGQTVGPFFHCALPYTGDNLLLPAGHPHAIRLYGTVYDGEGQGIPDALIELWQPDTDGAVVQQTGSLRRDGWEFTGWGRSATDAAGNYSFTTKVPGVCGDGRAPFFALTVFARGLLDALFTRAYLPHGDIGADPLLSDLDVKRRQTLLCAAQPDGYRFDLHLQGVAETVFLRYNATHS
ncbi:protocatechuate 3,4-dioxygenase subunit alpha [Mycobacterium arosiense]|uniref:protocatechuate 3,4-dioxygenase subunit alpha n=1 Tax=Mycobacterium arosiense TaxID=425468 RepID=UPI001150052C|nr:protocatechuate 3,4-dioxygenase subunit alpha [Mycobacterium arosiense]